MNIKKFRSLHFIILRIGQQGGGSLKTYYLKRSEEAFRVYRAVMNMNQKNGRMLSMTNSKFVEL